MRNVQGWRGGGVFPRPGDWFMLGGQVTPQLQPPKTLTTRTAGVSETLGCQEERGPGGAGTLASLWPVRGGSEISEVGRHEENMPPGRV